MPHGAPGPGEPDPRTIYQLRKVFTLVALGAAAVALVLGLRYLNLEWRGGQDIHRVAKMVAAGFFAFVFILRPAWTMAILPFLFPYVTWLPKSPIPLLNTMNLLLFALLVGWVGRTLSLRTRFLDASPWNLPVGVFAIWAVFSCFWPLVLHGDPAALWLMYTQHTWIALSGLILFFAIFNNIHTWKQIRTLAFLFCVGSAVGLLGLFKEWSGMGLTRRVGGGLGDINVAGAYYATCSLFVLGMLSAGFRGFWARLILLGSFAATIISLIIPASRGAFAGFVAGAVPALRRLGMVWLVILGLAVLAFLTWAPDYVKERVLQTQEAITSENRYEAMNRDAGGRLDFWKATIEVIRDHPVVGIGIGRISTVLREDEYLGRARPTHNLYLETAAEMGIPGLILLLWIFVAGFRASGRLLRRPGFPRALAMGYRSSLVALGVANIFGGRFFEFQMAGMISLLTALVFRARTLPDEEPGEGTAGTDVADSHPLQPSGRTTPLA